MKLTRTGAVFSKTTMLLFLCRNRSSQIGKKLFGELFQKIKKILEPRTTGGGTWGSTTRQGAPLQAHPGGLCPPGGPAYLNPNTIKSLFRRKNRGGRIVAFHETEPPPPPVLHREARSGVRLGLRRGESSVFIITDPPSSPIPLCSPPGVSNSFVDSLVDEEFDEIHHVIELVLLGLDP